MSFACDLETTGLDLHHGARPFLCTTTTDEGETTYWEWDVDPLTRMPEIPPEDLKEIRDLLERTAKWGDGFADEIRDRHKLIGHNSKFDCAALASVGVTNWPWAMTEDTLIAGHLLASNQPHDLTAMVYHYLGDSIEPFEKALEEAVKECRRTVQQARLRAKRVAERGEPVTDEPLAAWRIADDDLPEMPSAKGELWRADYWLPRAMVKWLWETSEACRSWNGGNEAGVCEKAQGWEYRPPNLDLQDEDGHPWWTVLSDYANADSASTVALWTVLRRKIDERGLGKIYRERMRCLPVTAKMEARGVTLSKARLEETAARFREESAADGAVCIGIAASMDYELTLPKSGNNKSLVEFCFGTPHAPYLRLPAVVRTETGGPSLSKPAIEQYLSALPHRSKQLLFVQKLSGKRSRDTACVYMEGYQRYWVHVSGETYRLHPNLNQTGTDTLRFSCSNPNTQNISKKEGFTLRYLFGPAPGREWWSLDYENIELKIPGYTAPEQAMIDLFEKPDEPPYFGSYHLMNASIIYPDLFAPLAGDKGAFKKKYAATWYQWCKNSGFALIYGCQEAKFDATAHKPGAYKLLKQKLPNLFKLADRMIERANRTGGVETIPDRTVDPARGYPIICGRTDYGKVNPTIPLNYHVQSTAMWCTAKAMVRVDEYLEFESRKRNRPHFMTLQVHDEIVLDLPAGGAKNLTIVNEVKRLMEKSGEDIGIPLTVAASYHPETWAAEGKV